MKKYSIFYVLIITLFISCGKDFTDVNQDPKNPSSVPAGSLFVYAIKNIARQDAEVSPNYNPYRLLVQHWTATQYLDESNWNFSNRNIYQTNWTTYYRNCLNNLKLAKDNVKLYVEDTVQQNTQLAMIDLLQVYVYHMLVTTYGDIPYSESLDPEKTLPKYDNQITIYKDLIARAQKDVANLNDMGDIKSYDLICGGSITKWKKFGNSILLKLAIGISDYDQGLASTVISSVSSNVISSSSDNVALAFQSAAPNTNPSYEYFVTRPQEYVGCKTLIDYMNTNSDLRLKNYFTTVSGNYVGGTPGAKSIYANFSKPSAKVKSTATLEYLFMDYAEVEFYLAEAAARNLGGVSGAATHYENAIKASFVYWGGTSTEASALIASVPYDAANWKQSIGMQAWVAMYNRGFNAWTFQRRLDFPVLPKPASASGPGFPVRYIYPTFEQNNNNANYSAASSAIGGDQVTTKLFWDKQ
jgi:hypothetical protein